MKRKSSRTALALAALLSLSGIAQATTKKLTIRHGPITNLDMPAMTMVFQVQDAAILDSVKAGDKIRFNAEKAGGAFTVTRVESAK